MNTKTEKFLQPFLRKDLPNLRPGDTVRVYQKIPASASSSAKATADKKATAGKKEERKEKSQIFEGLVIARKHGQEMGSTITVRKIISGVGVERIFPLHSPVIEKIEISKKGKVRRAKLYYLRKAKGKRAKLKKKEFTETIEKEKPENNEVEK